jgi:hypothetical protein
MHIEPVLLFVGGMLIVGGAANAFFPREALELDRLFVPKKSFLVLEKLGIAQPKVIRIAGYIAISLGMVFASLSFLLPTMMRDVDFDRVSRAKTEVKAAETKENMGN